MRAIIVFRKTMREMTRDLWMLGLTLAFTPFFVVMYWVWFAGGSTTYNVIVINQDQGALRSDGTLFNGGEDFGSVRGRLDAAVEVTVSDDGPGFAPPDASRSRSCRHIEGLDQRELGPPAHTEAWWNTRRLRPLLSSRPGRHDHHCQEPCGHGRK